MDKKEQLGVDNLFVYATKNETISEEVETIVRKYENISVMRLNNRLLEDLEKKNNQNKERITLEEFLSNEDNKKNVEEKALTLWGIITNNADLALSKEKVFHKTEVVKKTTLSHKRLDELIELLSLFGFVKVLEKAKFKFEFNENIRQASALADIVMELRELSVQVERYKFLHNKDMQNEVMLNLRKTVNDILFKEDNRGE